MQGGKDRQAAPGVVGLRPASLDGPQSTKSPLFPAEGVLPVNLRPESKP